MHPSPGGNCGWAGSLNWLSTGDFAAGSFSGTDVIVLAVGTVAAGLATPAVLGNGACVIDLPNCASAGTVTGFSETVGTFGNGGALDGLTTIGGTFGRGCAFGAGPFGNAGIRMPGI